MDEYIKRSEVVGLVEDKLRRCETMLEALAFASLRTKVMGLRSADVAPREEWISVEERWPETDGYYLVWNKEQRKIEIRFFHRLPPHYPVETYPEIRAYFGNCSDHKSITHWMPLPEPPKAKKPKAKQPKDSENYEKKRLLAGDCFHGEIWCRCPYCLTSIEAHSIPKDRICHKCGKEYL